MKKSNFLGYVAGTAIGLAAMFSPTKDQDTIDNKVFSNLKPANQQEQVMDKSYMPDLSSIVGAGEAYAGEKSEIEQAKAKCSEETGQDNCIYVDDYYKLAEPVDDPDMPEGLRVDKWKRDTSLKNTLIKSKSETETDNFDDGLFTDYFFNPKYNEPLKDIFEQDGYKPNKIQNFFEENNHEKSVSMYHDGYMLLFNSNEKSTYIFPISNNVINDILEL